jgi:hypothetical protein
MSNGEHDVESLERHYRITLDFHLLLRPITPEVCQESFYFNDKSTSAGEPHFRENIERQRRLYMLLRNDQAVLERYLLAVLTQEAGNFVYEGLPNAFDAVEEEELLVPLYEEMGEEDSQFFEECQEMGALDANTELIARAFKVEWIAAEVAEMSRRVEGDVKMASVVERTKVRLIRKLNTPG